MANATWKNISAGVIEPVYLLSGIEEHIFDTTIERLKKAIPILDETSIVYFDLEETPIEIVLEEADTLPFLEDRKLIIARNASFLTAQDKGREKVVHNLEVFESWLGNPSPTATVVFLAPYEKLDARKRITKLMQKQTTVIEAKRLQGRDLTTWIQHEAKQNDSKISSEIAMLLVDVAGDSLLSLATEIEKMATYLAGEGEITKEVIEMHVARTPEMDVFRLTDSYITGKVADSVSIYHDLLRNGEEPIMLTSLISSQIRLMIHVQSLRRKGYQQQQIAKTLKVHPFRVKLMMDNKKMPNEARLLIILNNLATIDYKLKSTSGKRERVLELFFMQGIRN
ncbi:DNA polymerase III subunit delta [Sporosarcina sp. FA9]|uniref:DNA polymerase III subunit delta n=1 Tax=Sporosarcina sp. FA9 TaxID=3413030 RepID=UPI003F65A184